MLTKRLTLQTEQTSISSLINDHKNGLIDLDTDYQRGIIWDEEQKALYIESLMLGMAPTNLIFNMKSDTGIKECIDGKQRMSSMVEFVDNKFPVEFEGVTYYYSKVPRGRCGKLLSTSEQALFLNISIHITKYMDLKYDDQVNVFKRLQYGSKLTNGEMTSTLFTDSKTFEYFNEYCNGRYKYVEKYVSSKKDRQTGKELLLYIICSLNGSDGGIITTWRQIETVMANYNSLDKLKKYLCAKDALFKKLFSDTLFNNGDFYRFIRRLPKRKFLIIVQDIAQLNDENRLPKLRAICNEFPTIREIKVSANLRGFLSGMKYMDSGDD